MPTNRARGSILLGLVDFLVALRRHVHRADIPRTYCEGVRHRRSLRTGHFHVPVDDRFRKHGDLRRHDDRQRRAGMCREGGPIDRPFSVLRISAIVGGDLDTRGSARQHILRHLLRFRRLGDRYDSGGRQNGHSRPSAGFLVCPQRHRGRRSVVHRRASALQSATISTALPFSLVMLVLVRSLFVGMRADLARTRSPGSVGHGPIPRPA